MPRPVALVVLGMHRSGTSALTRFLSLRGAALPGELLPAVVGDNDRGFWESRDFLDRHERFFSDTGTHWTDPVLMDPAVFETGESKALEDDLVDLLARNFADAPLFVIKDPRICRLVPVWSRALARFGADVRFVHTTRKPLEIAASLAQRDGLPVPASLMIWLAHCIDAERGSRGNPRVFVAFEDLLSDWRSVAAHVANELGLAWPRGEADAAPDIDAFLSPDLRRHKIDRAPSSGETPLHSLVTAWDAAQLAACKGAADLAAFDRIADAYQEATAVMGPYVSFLLSRHHETDRLLLEARKMSDELAAGLEHAARTIADRERTIADFEFWTGIRLARALFGHKPR